MTERIWQSYSSYLNTINVTAHRVKADFELYNVQDSLLPVELGYLMISPDQHVMDLGTGGGFPGIPLAVRFPEAAFTLVDSVQKKLQLIQTVAKDMELSNISVWHGRIEDLGHDPVYREKMDVVVTKALAKWHTLLELTLPLLKTGGILYAYQGPAIRDELQYSLDTIHYLGGGTPQLYAYDLTPDVERTLVKIEKVRSTPKAFPRKAPLPKDKPLTQIPV